MRVLIRTLVSIALFAAANPSGASCLQIVDAPNHIGETRCVSGKVLGVEQGNMGVHYLNFCETSQKCPFTVVVFPSDLRYVGDVRQLAGKTVEVHGEVKMYEDHAEIILSDPRQLKGESAQIPPLPKNYDVEKKGRFSAGTFSRPKSSKSTFKKRRTTPDPTRPFPDPGPE
jgi:hypothetical protein